MQNINPGKEVQSADALANTAVDIQARSTEGIRNQATPKNSTPNSGSLAQAAPKAANQTTTTVDPTAVAESLKGKGIPTRKIATLAEAIVARVNGQELTRSQRDVLRTELGRTPVQEVISDLLQKKTNGVDSAQNNGYDEVNAIENDVTESSAPSQVQNALSEEGLPNYLKPQNLMDELASSGVKYSLDEVIAISKTPDGQLLWLEQGNTKSGLTHILERHAADFASQGIEDIPQLLSNMVKNMPIKTGSNSKGLFADYVFNGNTYRVAFGTNGYIVSFYPID